MKSGKERAIAHYIAAFLLAAAGYVGLPTLYYALSGSQEMPLLTYYAMNALSQVFLFALPALLIVSAYPQRWQRFKGRFKRMSVDTAGYCMLGAVGSTVVVSLIILLWQPYVERMMGYVPQDTPLPSPANAGEWLLSVLCIAVVPAVSEEMFFRGFLQSALKTRFPNAALWLTALIFAAMHFEIASLPGLLLVGWVLGMLLERHSLTACMFFHAVYNCVVLILSTANTGIGWMGIMLSMLAYLFSIGRLKKGEYNDATDGTGL